MLQAVGLETSFLGILLEPVKLMFVRCEGMVGSGTPRVEIETGPVDFGIPCDWIEAAAELEQRGTRGREF